MSLSRIFESARRLGVPVIVTDSAGRDPLVVLPLEQFEAMAGETERKLEYAPLPASSAEKKTSVSPAGQRVSVKTQLEALAVAEPTTDELSLEERFYLEPIEDKPSNG